MCRISKAGLCFLYVCLHADHHDKQVGLGMEDHARLIVL
jgi:hypothetical protein